jgi:hypothetical protein
LRPWLRRWSLSMEKPIQELHAQNNTTEISSEVIPEHWWR